jgi:spermidine synthase
LFYALRHWAAIFSPGLLGGFQFAERLTLPACLLAAAGCTLLAAAGCRWASRSTRKGSGNAGRSSGAGRIAAAWAIVTTGFLAMAFDLLVLFLFQCLFGTVYQMLGILVAAFMAGFLIGGLAGSAWASRDPRGSRLILLDAGVLLLAPLFAASALLIQAARPETALPLGIPWLFLFAPFCGLLCGAQFPLAAAVLSRGAAGEPSRIGGILCACDLAGGLAGGLIVTLLLFPRFGLFGTLAIMGFLKAGSLLVLWRHFRSG